jgi:hypothetical protein
MDIHQSRYHSFASETPIFSLTVNHLLHILHRTISHTTVCEGLDPNHDIVRHYWGDGHPFPKYPPSHPLMVDGYVPRIQKEAFNEFCDLYPRRHQEELRRFLVGQVSIHSVSWSHFLRT